MMRKGQLLLLVGVLLSVCQQIVGQQLGGPWRDRNRYRNPRIQQYYSRLCRNTQCGFEEVCERRVYPCLIKPCPEGPSCVPTIGSDTKPGNCPHPRFIRPQPGSHRFACNTDYGCYEDNICCHGYRSSECRRPERTDSPRAYPRRY